MTDSTPQGFSRKPFGRTLLSAKNLPSPTSAPSLSPKLLSRPDDSKPGQNRKQDAVQTDPLSVPTHSPKLSLHPLNLKQPVSNQEATVPPIVSGTAPSTPPTLVPVVTPTVSAAEAATSTPPTSSIPPPSNNTSATPPPVPTPSITPLPVPTPSIIPPPVPALSTSPTPATPPIPLPTTVTHKVTAAPPPLKPLSTGLSTTTGVSPVTSSAPVAAHSTPTPLNSVIAVPATPNVAESQQSSLIPKPADATEAALHAGLVNQLQVELSVRNKELNSLKSQLVFANRELEEINQQKQNQQQPLPQSLPPQPRVSEISSRPAKKKSEHSHQKTQVGNFKLQLSKNNTQGNKSGNAGGKMPGLQLKRVRPDDEDVMDADMMDLNKDNQLRPKKKHRTLPTCGNSGSTLPSNGSSSDLMESPSEDSISSAPIQEDENAPKDLATVTAQYETLKRAYSRLKTKIRNVKRALASAPLLTSEQSSQQIQSHIDALKTNLNSNFEQLLQAVRSQGGQNSLTMPPEFNQLRDSVTRLEEENAHLRLEIGKKAEEHEKYVQETTALLTRVRSDASMAREELLVAQQQAQRSLEEKNAWVSGEKEDLLHEVAKLHKELAISQQEQTSLKDKMEFTQQQFAKEKEDQADTLRKLQDEVQKLQGEKLDIAQKNKSYEHALKLLYVQLKAKEKQASSSPPSIIKGSESDKCDVQHAGEAPASPQKLGAVPGNNVQQNDGGTGRVNEIGDSFIISEDV